MSAQLEHQQDLAPAEVISKTTTALAIVTHSLTEIDALDAGISELERQYKGVLFEVGTTAGMAEACKARLAIRKPRYEIQRLGKDAKSTLNEIKSGVDAKVQGYITRIAAVEDPVHEQIESEIKRKAAAKEAARVAEQARIAGIQRRIEDDIRGVVLAAVGQSSDVIWRYITDVEAIAIDESFAEMRTHAEVAQASTLARLRMAYAAAVKMEHEKQRLDNERAALDRQRDDETRKRKLRERVDNIRDFALLANLLTAHAVQIKINEAKAFVVDSSFEEFRESAENARVETIRTLVAIHAERVQYEAERDRLAREKAEHGAAAAKERERIAEEARQSQLKLEADERAHKETLRRQRDQEERESAQRRQILADEEERVAARLAAQKAEQEAIEIRRQDIEAQSRRMESARADQAPAPIEPAVTTVVAAAQSEFEYVKPARPSNVDIVGVLMREFKVDYHTVVEWLIDMSISL